MVQMAFLASRRLTERHALALGDGGRAPSLTIERRGG